ncbi:MAG: acetolactate synthase small subunit [Propionibacteriaceae bacterium]|jgi:acetolactate synthase-1/3 small subunit|nr:acetolactate synthase small subunit [Propionibacteriaceae bacterium]
MSTITTLSVLVQDNPGVLTRIAGLFARRAFNIVSLTVGPTERPGYSRITLVVPAEDEAVIEQVTKQLNKLIEVVKITEMARDEAVRRELVLVKVRADAATRADILALVETFRGKVVDVAAESLVIEVTGQHGKVQAFLSMIEPYGIKEVAQSGTVALARGSRAITDRSKYDRRAKSQRG